MVLFSSVDAAQEHIRLWGSLITRLDIMSDFAAYLQSEQFLNSQRDATTPYSPARATKYLSSEAVLVVGYDNRPNRKAWLVKGPWGTDWGKRGHVWVAMGTSGILSPGQTAGIRFEPLTGSGAPAATSVKLKAQQVSGDCLQYTAGAEDTLEKLSRRAGVSLIKLVNDNKEMLKRDMSMSLRGKNVLICNADEGVFNADCSTCPTEEDVYCCGGVKFANECRTKCRPDRNITCTRGFCPGNDDSGHGGDPNPLRDACEQCRGAPLEWVCANDTKVYPNACFLECLNLTQASNDSCTGFPGPNPPPFFCGDGDVEADACPFVVAPVCGSDLQTYRNKCEACRAKVLVLHEGECPPGDGCRCSREFLPVCGADGRVYPNKCVANCANVTYTEGPCNSTGGGCTCDPVYEPVCCGQLEFPNPCIANCSLNLRPIPYDYPVGRPGPYVRPRLDGNSSDMQLEQGVPPGCVRGPCSSTSNCGECPEDAKPVCVATVGPFANKCEACRAGYAGVAVDGPCWSSTDCPFPCSEEWSPVCCNGTVYGNQCKARCKFSADPNGAYQCTPGECRSENCCDGDPAMGPVCVMKDNKTFVTFANQCEACKQGVAVAYEGKCIEPQLELGIDGCLRAPQSCARSPCDDMRCFLPACYNFFCGGQCLGMCIPERDCSNCSTSEGEALVCGRSPHPAGSTYSILRYYANECYATCNGATVVPYGECKGPPPSSPECPVCETPYTNTTNALPKLVCGKDGVTYDACYACKSKLGVAGEGPCSVPDGPPGWQRPARGLRHVG